MVSFVADDRALLKDLRLFLEPVEVYDANGKLLGLFVPSNLERGKEIQARVIAQIDRAELERRRLSGEPGEPFSAVLERLQKLEAEMARRRAAGEPEFTTEEGVAYFRSLRNGGASGAVPPAAADNLAETGACPIP